MDMLNSLLYGFSIVCQPNNLLFIFLGCLTGTFIGVLPGIGPVGSMAMLLPITYHMTPVSAIITMAGIYYGAMYGGSTTSILMNIPGEASSIVTCFDGYQMAKQGRAGAALGMAAFASFIAGTVGLIGLMVFAVPLASFALRFGPPEYFSMVILGLTFVVYMAQGSLLKAFIMGCFGFILNGVALDPIFATARMDFNIVELYDGIGLAPMAMGIFGVAEILSSIEEEVNLEMIKTKIKGLLPTRSDWFQARWAIVRGSVLGFFLGVLPGGGAVLASFFSYTVEKKFAKEPERFGKGAIEGVAGPEAANNSASAGAFVPLLTLGIPTNAVMAMLFGAFIIHGIKPGPFLLTDHPEIFWGVISSMYIGNIMLLLLNLPLIPLWVKLLKVPQSILFPLILFFCIIGSYSINNSVVDVIIMVGSGVLGYLLKKFNYEAAPLLLAYILGPLCEVNFRQSMILSKGGFSIFFTRPISAAMLIFSFLLIVGSAGYSYLRKRKKVPLTPLEK
jgi:putative tricarboxylic transport membrane protein